MKTSQSEDIIEPNSCEKAQNKQTKQQLTQTCCEEVLHSARKLEPNLFSIPTQRTCNHLGWNTSLIQVVSFVKHSDRSVIHGIFQWQSLVTHLTVLIVWKFSNNFSMITGFNCSKRCTASRTNTNTSNAACSLLSPKNSISYTEKKTYFNFIFKTVYLMFCLRIMQGTVANNKMILPVEQ